MINFKLWFKAIRVPFFTATIIPVALGAIVAWSDAGAFSWFRFWLTLFGAILIHAGTNLINDYFDHVSGCDEANPNPTPFSGGSRVIQDGSIAPKKILYAAIFSFIIGGAIGLYLNYLCGKNVIIILGIAGISLAVFYNAKPFRIGYGSFGELAVGFGFGPLIVMGSYYVQAQTLPITVFLISVPIGILIALVLFINEFPDYTADKSVGKRTIVVILGKRNSVVMYNILLVVVYLSIIALVVFKILPTICLIAFLSIPLALKAFAVSKKNFDKIYELLPANASTIALHSLIGVLLCASIMLNKIF
ncbi:MAG: 1,4-dihydroxy-2-naphthoate octaprenyltransferase [Candidatus Omnitrophota bacterium]